MEGRRRPPFVRVERLACRRVVVASGQVEYFVVWVGREVRDGSWERRSALLVDVPGLVADFDTRHPDSPATICHSDRVLAQAEIDSMAMKENVAGNDAEAKNAESVHVDIVEGRGAENPMDLQSTAKLIEGQGMAMLVDGQKPMPKSSEAPVAPKPMEEQGAQKMSSLSNSGKKYMDEVTALEIPSYLDTPILELSFSGMVLQVRRPDEYALHNDAASASRDYKKRQSRFKQESVFQAEKLFNLSKTEAKSALEASLRAHKAYNRHPIAFPRGLGHVVASDTGVPFTKESLASHPHSLESHLINVGLRPKYFERDLPQYYPTLDSNESQRVMQEASDAVLERAVEHQERSRQLVRSSFRYLHGAVAPPPTNLFRDGVRRVSECDKCYGGPGVVRASIKAEVPVEEDNKKERDPKVALALARATAASQPHAGKEVKRWYDAHWSCWRTGSGQMGS